MAPITVHPYHTEPGLPLPTSVACELWGQGTGEWRGGTLGRGGGEGIGPPLGSEFLTWPSSYPQ